LRPLIISGFGTSIRVSGHALEVSNEGEGRHETFAAHQLPFDSVVVEGNSGTISFEAARFLAVHDIPVVFLRWDGSVLSTLLPRGPVAGELKLAQFAAHNNTTRRVDVARAILSVKFSKSVELLRFLSRFYPCGPEPVESEVKRGPPAESIPDLMGWEGRTAVAYWAEFSKVVNRLWPEARFVTRKGKGKSWAQSATDPVNALLNFGYSLLEGRVRQAVNSVGLEPSVGFLQETADSKLPLVYELQEPFRWLVDLSVVETIAGRQLDRVKDFITTENFYVRLRPHAFGLLSERLSQNFNRAFPFRGQRRTFDAVSFE
jgi:CRISPR-associated protein Cas1